MLLITLMIGVLIGNSVLAGGASPGSKEDPLVTKGFVENTLNSQLAQLQQQVAALQAEATTLKQQVAFLENQLGTKAPVDNQQSVENNQVTPQSNQDSEQAQTQTPAQTSKKVAYVKEEHSYVNARSGAGTNFAVVTKVLQGSKMYILDEQDDWYRVKLEDGRLAWVANWVVDVGEE